MNNFALMLHMALRERGVLVHPYQSIKPGDPILRAGEGRVQLVVVNQRIGLSAAEIVYAAETFDDHAAARALATRIREQFGSHVQFCELPVPLRSVIATGVLISAGVWVRQVVDHHIDTDSEYMRYDVMVKIP